MLLFSDVCLMFEFSGVGCNKDYGQGTTWSESISTIISVCMYIFETNYLLVMSICKLLLLHKLHMILLFQVVCTHVYNAHKPKLPISN